MRGDPSGGELRAVNRPAPSTPWEALSRPARLLLTSWPWRSVGYLLTSPLVPAFWIACAWPLGPLAGVPLGAVERWRLGLVDRGTRPSPHRRTGGIDPLRWAYVRLTEPVSWRELAYGLLLLPLGMVDAVLTIAVLAVPAALLLAFVRQRTDPDSRVEVLELLGVDGPAAGDQIAAFLIGLPVLAIALYLLTVLTAGRVHLARLFLVGDRERQLDNRLRQVSQSRSRIATGLELERRRIERDLHDGTQQRLTSLVLTLGLLRLELTDTERERGGAGLADTERERGAGLTDTERERGGAGGVPGDSRTAARELAVKAQQEAIRALGELRDLVRGIYPATLREQGLGPALLELADLHPLPVRVSVDLPRRPPPDAESTMYFAVCEALSNAAKHSGAGTLEITARGTRTALTVTVTDDGVGGADPDRGSGLLGIADRIEASGGTVLLRSPPGGPTRVRMELPCEW